MGLWKIVIGDKDSTYLHGVTLREDVRKVALSSKPQIKGQVRNLKDTGQVEILCISGNEPVDFKKAIENEIKENLLIKELPEIKILPSPINDSHQEDKIKGSETFKIIREDELTEMVWALRNAGAAVLSQEVIRGRNILRTLLAELLTTNIMINSGKIEREINIIALESMLREPHESISDEILIDLHSVYALCRQLNKKLDNDDKPTQDELAELNRQITEIVGFLKPISEKMHINIENNNN